MPDSNANALVVAHQLGARFHHILPDLPQGISWRQLEPEQAWRLPEDVSVLIAIPPRGGNVVVPEQEPAGWPGNLRWIHAVSAGVDEFPDWIYQVKLVTCGRGSNSRPIAEFVLASILAIEKKLPEIWVRDAPKWKERVELSSPHGKTLGLIGFGAIGQAIAARAIPFGLQILATRRAGAPGVQDGIVFADLDTVLAESEHLVIAAPLTAVTAGLIGRAALARVKRGVHLVNIARGRILDHDALLEALDEGRVGFATLDVTEPEPLPAGHRLYTHDRVHLSPHISSSGGERGNAVAALFSENLRRFIAGEILLGLVDPALGY